MGRVARRRMRNGAVAFAAALATGAGIATAAASTPPPSNAVRAGQRVNE